MAGRLRAPTFYRGRRGRHGQQRGQGNMLLQAEITEQIIGSFFVV
jgi:hypothetical protein